MLKRRPFWIALLVVVLAVAAVLLLRQRSPAQPPAAPEQPVMELLQADVTAAERTDLRQVLTLTGTLRPVKRAALKSRLSAQVEQVLVREGEPVKTGQVLIKMDGREYQANVAQARGSLQAARGQLAIASKNRENNQSLVARGFISKNAFATTQSEYQIALANVESAKGGLDVAQKSLSDTTLRSPIDGLVSQRTVEPGEKVSPDTPLLEVVDLSQLELEAAVPAGDVGRIVAGQEVQVRVEGIAEPLAAKVVRINPAVQAGSRSVLVYIGMDNEGSKLRAGMFAHAALTLERKENLLVVPQEAVRHDASGNYVYAISDNFLHRQPVKLGFSGQASDKRGVEIVDGLAVGTTVIRRNLGDLNDGTKVRLVQPDGTTAILEESAQTPESTQATTKAER